MADPLSRIIPADILIFMGRDQVARHLLRAAPDVHGLLRGVTAGVLTHPQATSDAALILADHLRELLANSFAPKSREGVGLQALIDILTEAAPFLRNGAQAVPR